MLRIPAWAGGAAVQKNGSELSGVVADEFFTVRGDWQSGDTVTLTLPLELRVTKWFNQSAAVERGPLLFALPIKERWIDLPERSIDRDPQAKQAGFLDFAVHPQSDWNYALHLAEGNVVIQEVRGYELGTQPFSPQTPPVEIIVAAKTIKSWKESGGNTTLIPSSPVVPDGEGMTPIQLIPYGGTNLRIAQFPWFE